MSTNPVADDYEVTQPSIDEIASEVALILKRRLDAKDIMRLLEIVFLDVDEAAVLLRVEPKTIRAWVSQNRIPHRKANGKVLFRSEERRVGKEGRYRSGGY